MNETDMRENPQNPLLCVAVVGLLVTVKRMTTNLHRLTVLDRRLILFKEA